MWPINSKQNRKIEDNVNANHKSSSETIEKHKDTKRKTSWKKKRNKSLLSVANILSTLLNKRLLLLSPILLIISVFTFSVNDNEAIMLYLDKLQGLSEHKIKEEQKADVQNFYLNNENKHPNKFQRHKIRQDFNRKRNNLKTQWEAQYKIKWPTVIANYGAQREIKHKVASSKNTQKLSQALLRKRSKRDINTNTFYSNKNRNYDENRKYLNDGYTLNYQAHHIIPIYAGGINVLWNITPLSKANHKILHDSIEEHACFEHSFWKQKIIRFILKIKTVFTDLLGDNAITKNEKYEEKYAT